MGCWCGGWVGGVSCLFGLRRFGGSVGVGVVVGRPAAAGFCELVSVIAWCMCIRLKLVASSTLYDRHRVCRPQAIISDLNCLDVAQEHSTKSTSHIYSQHGFLQARAICTRGRISYLSFFCISSGMLRNSCAHASVHRMRLLGVHRTRLFWVALVGRPTLASPRGVHEVRCTNSRPRRRGSTSDCSAKSRCRCLFPRRHGGSVPISPLATCASAVDPRPKPSLSEPHVWKGLAVVVVYLTRDWSKREDFNALAASLLS